MQNISSVLLPELEDLPNFGSPYSVAQITHSEDKVTRSSPTYYSILEDEILSESRFHAVDSGLPNSEASASVNCLVPHLNKIRALSANSFSVLWAVIWVLLPGFHQRVILTCSHLSSPPLFLFFPLSKSAVRMGFTQMRFNQLTLLGGWHFN